MDQEIEYAWTIQEGFLVREWPRDDPRFEVFGETRPAKTVGGDFYDFVRPDETTVGILIGDVSGKGVPAALTMAQILAEFRLRALERQSPAEVLQRLNSTFVTRSQRGIFCTLAYFRLDLATGVLTGANAGHHGALRIGPHGADLFAEASGLPIGILEKGTWADVETVLQPGETVLLYTDGIVEARGSADGAPGLREYGNQKLVDLVAGYLGPPQEVLHRVMDDVHAFCRPTMPHDDCTMIALRFLNRS
jgi:phosphoserine phosphatase RsbU/P